MLLRWTYYLVPRFILGTIFASLLVYGTLFLFNERIAWGYSGISGILVLLLTLFAFGVAWEIWNLAGRLQNRFLRFRVKRTIRKQNYQLARRFYRKLYQLQHSSHFFPSSKIETDAVYYQQYAEFLCQADFYDKDALKIFERCFELYPEDLNMAEKLATLIQKSQDIHIDNLSLIYKLHKLSPENNDLSDFLCEQLLKFDIYDLESQEIMLEAIRKNSYLKGRCLELLLKRFLQQQRSDAKGCEIYLEAFRLGMQTPELNLMLGRIAEKARFAEQPPSGETMIKGAFESLPEDEKASIKNQIRRERLQKLPLETEKETAKEKPVLSEREVIIQAPVPSKAEKKKIRVTDFSPQESVVMKFARAFKAQWHSLKWVFALLVMIVIAFALIKLIPAKKVEVPTSLEVVSDQPYTIQISAFKDRARAENIIREINRQGLKAYLVVTGDEVPWHQVRLGHFSTIAGARVVAEELKKRKIIRNYFIARFTPGNYIE